MQLLVCIYIIITKHIYNSTERTSVSFTGVPFPFQYAAASPVLTDCI